MKYSDDKNFDDDVMNSKWRAKSEKIFFDIFGAQ